MVSYISHIFANFTPIKSLCAYQQDPERRVYKAVREAIKSGYRHIDTAQQYRNEHEVGEAIRDEINEGSITREDVFITTKVKKLSEISPLWIPFV